MKFKGTYYYIVMISQRPIHILDEEYAQKDETILTRKSIPKWMDFNTIYFFEYSKKGDISSFKK